MKTRKCFEVECLRDKSITVRAYACMNVFMYECMYKCTSIDPTLYFPTEPAKGVIFIYRSGSVLTYFVSDLFTRVLRF
jgi:hypothetical protein